MAERITSDMGPGFAGPWRLDGAVWRRRFDTGLGAPMGGLLPNGSRISFLYYGVEAEWAVGASPPDPAPVAWDNFSLEA